MSTNSSFDFLNPTIVIPRACGVSSTLRPFDSITNAPGILDHPLEPVIGLAEGETRWRMMTAGNVIARLDRAIQYSRGPRA
jgi:hypothetical protein